MLRLAIMIAALMLAPALQAQEAGACGDLEEFDKIRCQAEQGIARAQGLLGLMYEYGRGVPQDFVRAHMWFNLAASRLPPGGVRDSAVKDRDRIAARMTPEQIAEAQRLARDWQPRAE